MPVERRWYEFTRENIEKIPKGMCGGYRIADANKITIYIGSSRSENVGIRGRLISHFISHHFPSAMYFKFAYNDFLFNNATEMESEAVKKHIKKYKTKPKHVKRTPKIQDNIWFL